MRLRGLYQNKDVSFEEIIGADGGKINLKNTNNDEIEIEGFEDFDDL